MSILLTTSQGVATAPSTQVSGASKPVGRVAAAVEHCGNVATQLSPPQNTDEYRSPFQRVGAFRGERPNLAQALVKAPEKVGCVPSDEMVLLSGQAKPASASPISIQTLFALQQTRVDTAALVLGQLGKDPTALKHISEQLQASCLKDDRAATKAELKAAKCLDKDIIELVASHLQRPGITSKAVMREAMAAILSARQALINGNVWNKVETSFEHNNQRYACTMIPAAQMKLGDKDIFPVSYRGHGVSSSSTREIAHATNLWTSEIRAQGHNGQELTLFKGVRHGTLSPYGLEKADEQRHAGAQNRAREVVAAALFARPELLRLALAGDVVPLQLVSTSLLTGGFGGEGDMLNDQIGAWKALCQARPLVLSLMGGDGKQHTVRVNLEVAAFNFGVNEFALKFHFGHTQADCHNTIALHQLLGEDLRRSVSPGGWVGEYLNRDPKPANAKRVELLSDQLKAVWAAKAHNRDGKEPYKAAQRAAMLAFEIGAVPCWNCKSGKDRTGMLDVELKREAVALHQNRGLIAPGSRLTKDQQRLLQQALLHGGNSEVQAYNTGAPGNKVMKDVPAFGLSYRSRVGDDEVWNKAQGLSRLV
ncbi:inositol phosphate phosphatase SopB [Pseudomonas fluorescens]|uniref:Inositol phosphate phosphatase SopB n=1 Tax=Pseudomonas fluorescens TaxID=294 RepID=A0A5E7HCF6_PSEFL|nr:inositol phosphate phosphatase SopB [Pseudomonas fluorescens]VVO61528.1 Inositol phosphate phosphatase SopB [Pseudomonas fluorescens]